MTLPESKSTQTRHSGPRCQGSTHGLAAAGYTRGAKGSTGHDTPKKSLRPSSVLLLLQPLCLCFHASSKISAHPVRALPDLSLGQRNLTLSGGPGEENSLGLLGIVSEGKQCNCSEALSLLGAPDPHPLGWGGGGAVRCWPLQHRHSIVTTLLARLTAAMPGIFVHQLFPNMKVVLGAGRLTAGAPMGLIKEAGWWT